ncbi:DegT/DnrJ/EryC1/StrS family aminotransferase [Roseomonas sp. JC162]|uniref:DegT/DnrJ/EryC1/StrS family aminotransferase n=1 Tax=Neoroseomonas marina TaxID=1232220 RepID=A0A848EB89_9PROT|nr:DegT/DnrJ/EryC1/StrS family aminotransferase [Neoroseomonas marina]NMJ41296.1 DegT/DnrJ/EryC1/StrS family aminotransferase [Neoroseomonas marina]
MTAPIALFDVKAQQALIRAELDRRIAAVLDSGRFINGPEVTELEEKLAAFAGVAHAVGVSSGTDALQIAMMAEGIGRGDAVFLPAFTYTATAEVPLVLGATPVFVDVDAETFNIDIADLEKRIAAVKKDGRLKPRAVVGVDLFGLPADWPAIEAICAREGMFALDDAAQAFGARLGNRRLGGWGGAAALSFYPTKTLGAYGDGGALLTNDADRADLFRSLRTHGEGKTRYEVERTGMNGRLDTLQATILCAKMGIFEQELGQRRRIGAAYDAAFAGKVGVQVAQDGAENCYGLYTIRLPDAAVRARVQQALSAQQIGSGIYYPKPLHHQPAYAAHHAAAVAGGPAPLPVSEALCHQVLSLPMHPYMSEADAARVAGVVLGAL